MPGSHHDPGKSSEAYFKPCGREFDLKYVRNLMSHAAFDKRCPLCGTLVEEVHFNSSLDRSCHTTWRAGSDGKLLQHGALRHARQQRLYNLGIHLGAVGHPSEVQQRRDWEIHHLRAWTRTRDPQQSHHATTPRVGASRLLGSKNSSMCRLVEQHVAAGGKCFLQRDHYTLTRHTRDLRLVRLSLSYSGSRFPCFS